MIYPIKGVQMSLELTLTPRDFENRAILPLRELGVYEAVWNATTRSVCEDCPDQPEQGEL